MSNSPHVSGNDSINDFCSEKEEMSMGDNRKFLIPFHHMFIFEISLIVNNPLNYI